VKVPRGASPAISEKRQIAIRVFDFKSALAVIAAFIVGTGWPEEPDTA